MVGGEHRISKGVKIVTENYVWSSRARILSGAVRFFGDRLSADLGLFVPVGAKVALPIVNFVWTF